MTRNASAEANWNHYLLLFSFEDTALCLTRPSLSGP